MFNKQKCKTCKYHGYLGSSGYEIPYNVMCNYAAITNQTCHYKGEGGKVEDRRGSDPENCQLYTEGRQYKRKIQPSCKN